ncbi:MAG: transglutaminase domain-containing protein [Nitrospinae bacterium]|nr:transglutaminase domain-containing protein [Nitrospinota bacterium]
MRKPVLRAVRFLSLFLLFTTFAPLSASADKLLYDQWMEVFMNGQKIGFSHMEATATDAGYSMNSKSVMRLDVGGSAVEISASQSSFLDKSFRPLRFTYMQKELNHQQFFDGVVEGKKINVTVKSGGNTSQKTVDFGDQVYISDAMGLLLGQKKLEEGKKFEYRVFIEPLLATEAISVETGKRTELEIGGKKIPVTPVTMRFKNFLTVSYFSDEGRIVREISPMGFVSDEVDEARAVNFSGGVMSFTTLLSFSLIPLEKPLEKADKITSFKVRLSGLGSKGLLPQDDRQKITKEEKSGKNGGEFSVELSVQKNNRAKIIKAGLPASATKFAAEMAPSLEAQSDDPAIKEQAKKIIGDETDLFRAALKINRWVYEHVEKKYLDTFSAVETLKTMEGECQAHTNLFTALARSVGIPTRTVSGIVYAEGFNGFLYHAWPEVYAGEWVAMDPTFGQEVADATHIKLLSGELGTQLQLFEFLGKIRMEILHVER